MGYTLRTAVAPLALLGSVDQGLSVDNDIYFKGELDKRVGAHVYNSIALGTTTGVVLWLTFDTERFDTDAIHDGANPGRLTCKTAGKYLIGAHVSFVSNAAGIRQLTLRINGATYIAAVNIPAINGAASNVGISTLWDMAVNDYAEIGATQTSGGNLNVDAAAAYSPEFWMERIG